MNSLKAKFLLILWENNPILRAVAEPLALPLTSAMKEFAHLLIELMWEYDWVWLAAPQVGRSLRMIATTQWKVKDEKYTHLWDTVMINPEIVSVSDKTLVSEEGCLSLPWISGYVERPAEVTVSFFDIDGKKVKKKYSGFNAIIVLHEIDHLNGILFIDKTTKELPRWEL